MEATGRKADQVRIFRQAFTANDPLRMEFSKLVQEPGSSRPFSMFGSDERVIDSSLVETNDFEIRLRQANQYMQTREKALMAVNNLVVRPIKREGALFALRLVMEPVNEGRLIHNRIGLDMLEAGTCRNAFGLEALKLYAIIPTRDLLPP